MVYVDEATAFLGVTSVEKGVDNSDGTLIQFRTLGIGLGDQIAAPALDSKFS